MRKSSRSAQWACAGVLASAHGLAWAQAFKEIRAAIRAVVFRICFIFCSFCFCPYIYKDKFIVGLTAYSLSFIASFVPSSDGLIVFERASYVISTRIDYNLCWTGWSGASRAYT